MKLNKIIKVLFLFILLGTQFISAQEKGEFNTEELLSMSLEELMNLKVSVASKHYEKVADIPASIIIITKEEIENFGYKTVEDILQNIAGFYMIDDYFWLGSVNFGMRGFYSTGSFNDVIITINGINQVGDSNSDFPSSKINVPVEVIDRIEVVRGPMSVIYGSGAFMGAINIITNQDKSSSDYFKATGTIGSLNSKKITAKFGGKEGRLRYVFNGGISSSDGIDEPFSKMMSEPSNLKNFGLSPDSKTGKMLSDNRKYFGLSVKLDGLNFDFEHNETIRGVFDGLPSIKDGTLIHVNANNVSLNYQKNLSDKILFTSKFGFFTHNYSWNYSILFDNAYATNSTNTSSYEIEINSLYNNEKNFDVMAGLYFRSISHYDKNYDYPIYADLYSNTKNYISGPNVKWYALYCQSNLKVQKDIQLTLGLRLEKLNKYNMIISAANETNSPKKYDAFYDEERVKVIPRAAIIYKLSNNNIFKFLYGKAVKQPSVNQNFSQLLSGYSQLKPAEVTTYEFNYIYASTSKYGINFSVFRNELKDLIVKRNIFNQVSKTWSLHSINKGRMSTLGAELSINVNPLSNLNIELSGSYQKSKNDEKELTDIDLGYAPLFLGYTKVAYKFSKNITIALLARYVDEMETVWNELPIDPQNGNLTPVGRIGNKIEDYFVGDLNIRCNKLFASNWFFSLSVSNLFDQEIRYPTTWSNDWADNGTLGYGRTMYFKLGCEF